MTVEIVRSLEGDYDPLWGSLVKQPLRRVHPGFTESYYDFKSFADLLKAAEKQKLLSLDYDAQRGNYIVTSQ